MRAFFLLACLLSLKLEASSVVEWHGLQDFLPGLAPSPWPEEDDWSGWDGSDSESRLEEGSWLLLRHRGLFLNLSIDQLKISSLFSSVYIRSSNNQITFPLSRQTSVGSRASRDGFVILDRGGNVVLNRSSELFHRVETSSLQLSERIVVFGGHRLRWRFRIENLRGKEEHQIEIHFLFDALLSQAPRYQAQLKRIGSTAELSWRKGELNYLLTVQMPVEFKWLVEDDRLILQRIDPLPPDFSAWETSVFFNLQVFDEESGGVSFLEDVD